MPRTRRQNIVRMSAHTLRRNCGWQQLDGWVVRRLSGIIGSTTMTRFELSASPSTSRSSGTSCGFVRSIIGLCSRVRRFRRGLLPPYIRGLLAQSPRGISRLCASSMWGMAKITRRCGSSRFHLSRHIAEPGGGLNSRHPPSKQTKTGDGARTEKPRTYTGHISP